MGMPTFSGSEGECSERIYDTVALPFISGTRGALFRHTADADVVPVFSIALDPTDRPGWSHCSQTQGKSTIQISIHNQESHCKCKLIYTDSIDVDPFHG